MTDLQSKSWKDFVWESTRKTRTVLFSSDVSNRSVSEIVDTLLALEDDDPEKPITILINSPGGSVNDGYALVDIIRFISPQVRVVGAGLVASMGISLLLSVDKEFRFCLPNTRFMLHQPRFMGTVRGTVAELEITASEMLKMKDKSNQEVADATGQTLDKVAKDTARDFWLGSDEALKYGLVTQVISDVSELSA
ncbi:MAG TPA: ATP-dependent Clp protease proteolytic subunit [Myxococcales bacterium]|nr:ATP-dependent Clp protease proteolytic subunit [Myxococcales bacterium]